MHHGLAVPSESCDNHIYIVIINVVCFCDTHSGRVIPDAGLVQSFGNFFFMSIVVCNII